MSGISNISIFGIHAVARVLRVSPDRVTALTVLGGRNDERINFILDAAKSAGIAIAKCSRRELDSMAGSRNHQGVVASTCAAQPLGEKSLEDILDRLETDPFLLVLDGVQDPHNLGACLRSADAAGVDAVIVPKDRAAGLTPVARKVASGAAETVPLIRVTNLARTLRGLKKRDIWMIGGDGDAEITLYEQNLSGALALVLGAEGQGLRRLTKQHCDALVALPMLGMVESLNVSVAVGVCLYEALRQRKTCLKSQS